MAGSLGDLVELTKQSSSNTLGGFEKTQAPFTFGDPAGVQYVKLDPRDGGLTPGGSFGFRASELNLPNEGKLRDLLGTKVQSAQTGLNNLGALADRAFNPSGEKPVNYLRDLSINTLGRFALLNRLEEQFGPDFRNVPAAQAVLSQFENLLTQQNDIESLQRMLESSNKVFEYLKLNPTGVV